MPNHVTNRLAITGNNAIREKLLAAIGTDYPEKPATTHTGEFIYTKDGEYGWWNPTRCEFMHYGPGRRTAENKVITNEIPEGWTRKIDPAWRQHIDFEKILPCPPLVNRSSLSMEDEAATPGRNWYAWNVRRWGTKWNACSTKMDEQGRIVFDTAWSFPAPVLEELSHLFPELTLTCETVDEGGWFWGTVVFEGGRCIKDAVVASKDALPADRLEETRLNKELRSWESDDA